MCLAESHLAESHLLWMSGMIAKSKNQQQVTGFSTEQNFKYNLQTVKKKKKQDRGQSPFL